jgi:hypothetical protein
MSSQLQNVGSGKVLFKNFRTDDLRHGAAVSNKYWSRITFEPSKGDSGKPSWVYIKHLASGLYFHANDDQTVTLEPKKPGRNQWWQSGKFNSLSGRATGFLSDDIHFIRAVHKQSSWENPVEDRDSNFYLTIDPDDNKLMKLSFRRGAESGMQFKFIDFSGHVNYPINDFQNLKHVSSGKYLAVQDGELAFIDRKDSTSAMWKLVFRDGYFFIQSSISSDWLSLKPGGIKKVILDDDSRDGKLKRWQVIPAGKNSFKLKNDRAGYLAVSNGSTIQNGVGDDFQINANSEVRSKAVVVPFKNRDHNAAEVHVINKDDGSLISTLNYGEVKELLLTTDDVLVFKRKEFYNSNPENVNYNGEPSIKITKDIRPIVLYGGTIASKVHPAIDDNNFGYDLRKMHPFDLTREEAKKEKLFNDLITTENSKPEGNQNYGSYNIHRQFEYDGVTIRGELSRTEDSYSSDEEFEKSFSFGGNVSVEEPVSGVGGGLTGGFSKLDNFQNSHNHVFAKYEKKETVFTVSLIDNDGNNAQVPDLTVPFICAIRDLPVIDENITKNYNVRSHSKFNAYKNFLDKWGTHYAKKIVYGGRYTSVYRSTYDAAAETHIRSWNFGNQGSVPLPTTPPVNISGGIDIGGSKKDAQAIASSKDQHDAWWTGGDENSDTWNVTETNAEPVEMTFAPISELFRPSYVKIAGISEDELERKRNMMYWTMKSLLPDERSWQNIQPKESYSLQLLSWKFVKRKSGGRLYGKVDCGFLKDGKYTWEPFWEVRKDDNKKLFEGYTYTYGGLSNRNPDPVIYHHDPNKGSSAPRFYIFTKFIEKDAGQDDTLENKTHWIDLGHFPESMQVRTIQIRSGYGDVDVRYRLFKLKMNFDF